MTLRIRVAFAPPLALALLACTAPPAHAGWPNNPVVSVPLCTASGGRDAGGACTDGAGGAIVCWRDSRSGTGDIYAQRVSASGQVMWTANGVPVCTATGLQSNPRITSDGAGGAIMCWADQRGASTDIYAQRVSPDGKMRWTTNGVAICTASGTQNTPLAVPDGAGGAFVLWEDQRNANYDVFAQYVDAGGAVLWTANGEAVCDLAAAQDKIMAVPDGDGGVVIAWWDARNGNRDFYAQRMNAGGSAEWAADGVPVCTEATSQQGGDMVSDGAGGLILAWYDMRSGGNNIYAQRLDGDGVAKWTADGVTMCGATGEQTYAVVTADGAGGAIVAWRDARAGIGTGDVYAQRVNASGVTQWTANGVAVCGAAGVQQNVSAIADGVGGAILCWQDDRSGSTDFYAQRLNGSGAVQWTANGVAVSTAPGGAWYSYPVSDGAGGVILAWDDDAPAYDTVVARRVDQWGYLGPQPVIADVADVPGDQGNKVKVSWYASPLDSFPAYSIDTYHAYRSVPPNLVARSLRAGARIAQAGSGERPTVPGTLLARPAGTTTIFWEYLGSVSANHLPGYSCLAPTPCDSMAGSNPRTLFMIEARNAAGTMWWFSDPDSGYSVDNLAPAMPAPFTAVYSAGNTSLGWGECGATDFAEFRLYRGHEAGFVPSAANLVTTLTSTAYVDAAGAPYFYKLCAVDIHGNVSPYAFAQPAGTVDAPGSPLPRELALSQPAPNPLRGSCTLTLALPRAADVALAVYDQQGRRVRTLVAGALPAGEHPIAWDGRDEGGRAVASGIYFVRCAAEGRAFTRRIAALR